ncbi:hypothetical protein LIER_16879 [Lithospermum erythrorhizon]|uniref:Reverse transcriptase domain-containing protein n=1 Tax=Lithospermum erythrorhizon TaxID=34254 RepID=A0AAV3QCF1_LITER
MSHEGCRFTWCRNWEERSLLRVLDRVVCNARWVYQMSTCTVNIPAADYSDHCPIDVLVYNNLPGGPKPFKYQLLFRVWEECVEGNSMQVLVYKMKCLKKHLKQLNNEAFSNISTRVTEKHHELVNLNDDIFNGKILILLYLKRLKDGDSSTKYFHACMRMHHSKSRITSIQNEGGILVHDQEEVAKVAVNFYKGLFKGLFTEPSMQYVDLSHIHSFAHRGIDEADQTMLAACVTNDEIEKATLNLKGGKALGPDGYPMKLIKDTWAIIGRSVIDGVKHFFMTGQMPRSVNCTALSLIPKVQKPLEMKQFRPIACCNSLYKIITSIVATRLNSVLSKIVGIQETAYVPNRRIIDGILLMQEMMNGYHKKSGKPRCAIKVDIMKAYDTVRLGFSLVYFKDEAVP